MAAMSMAQEVYGPALTLSPHLRPITFKSKRNGRFKFKSNLEASQVPRRKLILTDKTDSCTMWTAGICINTRNIPADIKNKSFR